MNTIALSGGGSLGCFEAGFLYATFNKIKFTNLYGTSAGSLNCLLLAQSYINGNPEILKQTYCEKITGNSSIYSKNYFKTIFGWGTPPYSYGPLKKLIKVVAPNIKEMLTMEEKITFTSVDLVTGEIKNISNHDGDITEETFFNAVVASASMPPVFMPVSIGKMKLVDGGLRANIPIQNIIETKKPEPSDQTVVVLCYPLKLNQIDKDYNGLIEISSRALDIMMFEASHNDLNCFIENNKLVKELQSETIKSEYLNQLISNKHPIDIDIIYPDSEMPGNTLEFNPVCMKLGFKIGVKKGEQYLKDVEDGNCEKYHNF